MHVATDRWHVKARAHVVPVAHITPIGWVQVLVRVVVSALGDVEPAYKRRRLPSASAVDIEDDRFL